MDEGRRSDLINLVVKLNDHVSNKSDGLWSEKSGIGPLLTTAWWHQFYIIVQHLDKDGEREKKETVI